MNRGKHKLLKRFPKINIKRELPENDTAIIFLGSTLLPIHSIAKEYATQKSDFTLPRKSTTISDEKRSPYISADEVILRADDIHEDDLIAYIEPPTSDNTYPLIGYTRSEIEGIPKNKGIIMFSSRETSVNIYNYLKNKDKNIIVVQIDPDPMEVTILLSKKREERYGVKNSKEDIENLFYKVEKLLSEESNTIIPVDIVIPSVLSAEFSKKEYLINDLVIQRKKSESITLLEEVDAEEHSMPVTR